MSRKEQLQMEEEESSNEQEENIRISKSTKASGTTRSKQNMRETGAPNIIQEVRSCAEKISRLEKICEQILANSKTFHENSIKHIDNGILSIQRTIRNPKYSDWWKVIFLHIY
jgi:high-affinity K+ transport system ATPase subunit B